MDVPLSTASVCRLCGGGIVREYQVREMMHGTRDVFVYQECGQCAALQRADLLADLAPYYPRSYHAYRMDSAISKVAAWARRLRNWLALSRQSPVRFLMNRVAPPRAAAWLDIPGLRSDTRILDVGCGRGTALRQLAEGGFTNLTGVDPFLPEVVEPPPSVRMIRGEIGDVDGQFDYITFHHSFEHIADQQNAMQAAAARLSPGGCLLIRLPTVSSHAWRTYREHWFQIDAPRHFVLHSVESLTRLARHAGLTVERIVFDSNENQILYSEAYARGVAISDQPSFSPSEIQRARLEAARLNARRDGDQIAAYFRKPSPGETDGPRG